MNENKHIRRFWDGYFMFVVPIIVMIVSMSIFKMDIFRIIFIFQLLLLGMYIEGLAIDKVFRKGKKD